MTEAAQYKTAVMLSKSDVTNINNTPKSYVDSIFSDKVCSNRKLGNSLIAAV